MLSRVEFHFPSRSSHLTDQSSPPTHYYWIATIFMPGLRNPLFRSIQWDSESEQPSPWNNTPAFMFAFTKRSLAVNQRPYEWFITVDTFQTVISAVMVYIVVWEIHATLYVLYTYDVQHPFIDTFLPKVSVTGHIILVPSSSDDDGPPLTHFPASLWSGCLFYKV